MKYTFLALLLLSTSSVFGKGAASTGFIEVRHSRKLYVEHHPAAPGRPTVFLLNGLTYTTKQFDDYVKALRDLDPGVGVVAYDMTGMGQTLLANKDASKDRVPVENQIRDLYDLVRKMNIQGPKSVVGLSYGGGLELLYSTYFPDDFVNFIGFAPLLERLPDQDMFIRNSVNMHRLYFPLDPRNPEELYDFYLRNLIYATYPAAEPIVLENYPYKLEAVFRLVQGIKHWNAFEVKEQYPKGKIHIIAARQDEHVKLERLNKFWEAVPESARASYLRLDSTTHKIPEVWPKQAAAWTLQILSGNPDLHRGLIFEGDPYKNEAKHSGIRIPLNQSPNKAGNCESLLGEVPE